MDRHALSFRSRTISCRSVHRAEKYDAHQSEKSWSFAAAATVTLSAEQRSVRSAAETFARSRTVMPTTCVKRKKLTSASWNSSQLISRLTSERSAVDSRNQRVAQRLGVPAARR